MNSLARCAGQIFAWICNAGFLALKDCKQVEGQRAEQAHMQQKTAVLSKVDRIRDDQSRRMQELERAARESEQKVSPL